MAGGIISLARTTARALKSVAIAFPAVAAITKG
jgi:hypothetical protein